MKNRILTVVFFLISLNVFSQDTLKNEIGITIGGFPSSPCTINVLPYFETWNIYNAGYFDKYLIGVFGINYTKSENNYFYGGNSSFYEEKIYYNGNIGEKDIYLSLMFNFGYNYINQLDFKLYSRVYGGATFLFVQGYDCFYPAYHITILGLKYGEKWCMNVELGIGILGVLNIGLNYKF